VSGMKMAVFLQLWKIILRICRTTGLNTVLRSDDSDIKLGHL